MIDDKEKARLVWHCRRGMLELDLILQKFIENQMDSLTLHQIKSFDQMLSYTDPELYAWLMGYEDPSNKELLEIVTTIRNNT